jgi:outer membrane biosynthesis protein TonB
MASYEQQKNTKAFMYTLFVCACLAVLFFMVSWAPPVVTELKEEDGMEVNLGSSETGIGDIQPLLPGDQGKQADIVTPPTPSVIPETPVEKEIETNENDKEAPPAVVKKPIEKTKVKAEVKPVPVTESKPVIKLEPKPVEVPPAPKPKILFKGQGNGGTVQGNNSDSYQSSSGQGITGARGDQGKPNGNPNSDSYTGNGGTGNGNGAGVSISRGLQGRKINRYPSFEDDFNENAKVAVDIKVDGNGNVTSASFQPKGSTTTNANMKSIALAKARQLKFNSNSDEVDDEMGTVIFNFRIKN